LITEQNKKDHMRIQAVGGELKMKWRREHKIMTKYIEVKAHLLLYLNIYKGGDAKKI